MRMAYRKEDRPVAAQVSDKLQAEISTFLAENGITEVEDFDTYASRIGDLVTAWVVWDNLPWYKRWWGVFASTPQAIDLSCAKDSVVKTGDRLKAERASGASRQRKLDIMNSLRSSMVERK